MPAELRGGAVAIGNFDGVHLGHQAVIGAAAEAAQRLGGAPVLALTFEQHPRQVFRPNDPPFRLTPLREKAAALATLGVDALVVLRFTPALAASSPVEFIDRVLVGDLGARHIAIGADFCFGHKRSGNAALLAETGARTGAFGVTAVPQRLSADGAPYSSTLIRDRLQTGDVTGAAALLGRPPRYSGRVAHGDKRGRLLGFPTANIPAGPFLRPKAGVYALWATLADGTRYGGVANFGARPTVAGREERWEIHLFDYAGDLYGQRLCFDLVGFLRPEQKFDGLEALTAQIARDAAAARALLSASAIP